MYWYSQSFLIRRALYLLRLNMSRSRLLHISISIWFEMVCQFWHDKSRCVNSTSGSSGGGAHPARAPPNDRGPMIFFMPKTLFFSQVFRRSLRSRLSLSLILIEIWPKHAKNDFYFNPSTLSIIFCPPPRWQSPRPPPLRLNPGSATE